MEVAAPESSFSDLVREFSSCVTEELQFGIEQLDHIERATMISRLAMLTAFASNETPGSASSFMSIRMGLDSRSTSELIRVGSALVFLPCIASAFLCGDLLWKQVVQLTRFVSASDDAEWAEKGFKYSINQLERLGDEKQVSDELADSKGELLDPVPLSRRLRYGIRGDRLKGFFDIPLAYGGEELKKTIDRMADAASSVDEQGRSQPLDRLRADCLVDLVKQTISESSDPDRANISVHVSVDENGKFSPTGALGGNVMAFPRLAEYFCEGRIRVIEEREGRIVGVGRNFRITPQSMAEQVRYRDGGCRFPGCSTTRRTHVHHILEWENDGETDFHNLIELCSRHHHLLHASRWKIRGDANHPVDFVNEYGTIYAGRLPVAIIDVKKRKHRILDLFDWDDGDRGDGDGEDGLDPSAGEVQIAVEPPAPDEPRLAEPTQTQMQKAG